MKKEKEEEKKGEKRVDGVGGVGDRELVLSSGLHHVHHDVPGGEEGRPGAKNQIQFSHRLLHLFVLIILMINSRS